MSNLLSFCLHSLSYSRQSVVKEISLHFHRVVLVICLILLNSCIDICFYGKEDALSENELVHGKIQLQEVPIAHWALIGHQNLERKN
jgi:hypothetical protein